MLHKLVCSCIHHLLHQVVAMKTILVIIQIISCENVKLLFVMRLSLFCYIIESTHRNIHFDKNSYKWHKLNGLIFHFASFISLKFCIYNYYFYYLIIDYIKHNYLYSMLQTDTSFHPYFIRYQHFPSLRDETMLIIFCIAVQYPVLD